MDESIKLHLVEKLRMAVESGTAGGTMARKKSLRWFDKLEISFQHKVYRRCLYGPPGLGKSKTPQEWAKDNGWDYVRFTLTPQTDPTELKGHFILQGSEFVWMDGYITRAWNRSWEDDCTGVIVQMDEISHAGPDIQSTFHAVLDDEDAAVLSLPTGEDIKPCPGKVMYVATMNDKPEDLPEALRDRFTVAIEVNEPHPAILELVQKDLREPLQKTAVHPDATRRISVRKWIDFATLREVSDDATAGALVFGDEYQAVVDAIHVAEGA